MSNQNDTSLVKIQKSLPESKTGNFPVAGHLKDQTLKYNNPKDQISIFDNLGEYTKNQIRKANVEVKEIIEGIRLTPSEQKVIDCLCKLLHDKSQTSEPNKDTYYSGNRGLTNVEYGGDTNEKAPQLAFTLYELTKEYKGGDYVAGKDISNVNAILDKLDKKQFLFSYIETEFKSGGHKTERKIEGFYSLIKLLKISEKTFIHDVEQNRNEEIVIALNPIFRRQINSKFILYPNDINKRTTIAYGSHNVSETALRLRDYLIRELSSKHYKPEINLEKLYWILNDKWMKENRKKKVKDFTEKALETVKSLGLVINYEIVDGASGDSKIIFNLNKEWI